MHPMIPRWADALSQYGVVVFLINTIGVFLAMTFASIPATILYYILMPTAAFVYYQRRSMEDRLSTGYELLLTFLAGFGLFLPLVIIGGGMKLYVWMQD